ncbi:MAG: hypothetical protein BJ554DRAFT_7454 [Olpidium bornovanus]|uniref:Uncharacterized protein n=1 Tax=Olpidium bornovanus TaxID=278681 RepID=A0A8H8DJV0_9FUNG|nr:MAG: hypothetical protein BJ554DRAFT_7454 [Olpidium bornovanus]
MNRTKQQNRSTFLVTTRLPAYVSSCFRLRLAENDSGEVILVFRCECGFEEEPFRGNGPQGAAEK